MGSDPLDQFLNADGTDPLDAFIAAPAPGPRPPPSRPRGPGPWADEYVGARRWPLPPPNSDLPLPTPTDADRQEFERLPFLSKLGRMIRGDVPETRAARRMLEAQVQRDPGLKGVLQLESAGRAAVTGGFAGGLAGLGLKAAAGAGPAVETGVGLLDKAVPVAARVGSQGLEAGVNAAAGAGSEAADEGRPVLPAAAEGFKQGVPVGVGFGAAGEVASKGGRSLSNFIRGMKNPAGEDIRLLEQHGYTPATLTPTQSMAEPPVYGPPPPQSPSEALGVTASPRGRGIVGEQGARRLEEELATRERFRQQRLGGDLERQRRPAVVDENGVVTSPGGQMHREVSVEDLIPQIESEMNSSTAQMVPKIRSSLGRALKILTDRTESSAPMSKYIPTAGEPVRPPPEVETTPLDDYAGVERRRSNPPNASPKGPFPEQVGSVGQIEEKLLRPYTNNGVVVDRLDRPGTFTRAGSAEGGEEFRVPMGDIRRRVEGPPNRVMTIAQVNELRDALDEVANIAKTEGVKGDIPGQKLANQLRQIVRTEAPAVGLANRRSSAVQAKTERIRELMKDPSAHAYQEPFGMQLAGQGEEGAKTAGAREARLADIRENFPTSERLTRRDVDTIFDNPRLLQAEERLQLKSLPRIGGGSGQFLNLAEPMLGRLAYPFGRALDTPLLQRGLLGSLARARRQGEGGQR